MTTIFKKVIAHTTARKKLTDSLLTSLSADASPPTTSGWPKSMGEPFGSKANEAEHVLEESKEALINNYKYDSADDVADQQDKGSGSTSDSDAEKEQNYLDESKYLLSLPQTLLAYHLMQTIPPQRIDHFFFVTKTRE